MLLKNDAAAGLPFEAGKKLAVIGVDVDSIEAIMQPSNYNADNICPHKSSLPGAEKGVDFSCLQTVWAGLNSSNAAAGGSASLLTQSSWAASYCWDSGDPAGPLWQCKQR